MSYKREHQKRSDKVNIIDQKTFGEICNNDKSGQTKNIRNSKYKKTHKKTADTFNVFDYLLIKPKKPKGTERKRVKKSINCNASLIKKPTFKRGKKREFGNKKKVTRLKKSILSYRKLKKLQENAGIETITKQICDIQIQDSFKTEEESKTNILHSRRFREYCDNCTTPLLGELTDNLLRQLDRFQKRAYAQNAIKARAHRRFVIGFREVQNFLVINKVKLVLIAPDCEKCPTEDGLDETINQIKAQCSKQQIPYIFSLRKRQLAYTLFKKVPISCIGILDYDGAREIYSKLMEALQEARKLYTESIEQKNTQE